MIKKVTAATMSEKTMRQYIADTLLMVEAGKAGNLFRLEYGKNFQVSPIIELGEDYIAVPVDDNVRLIALAHLVTVQHITKTGEYVQTLVRPGNNT